MWCVITGDVVKSQSSTVAWLDVLKKALSEIATEGKDWEVFRGDSFQLIAPIQDTIYTVVILKAALKSHNLDVRLGIGLGEVSQWAPRISESQGSAFVHSGEAFDGLGRQLMAVRSVLPNHFLIESGFAFMSFVIETWSEAMARTMHQKMLRPHRTQSIVAEELGVAQSYISAVQKRAGLKELLQFEEAFQKSLLS